MGSSVRFQQWMQRVQSEVRACDAGYPIGRSPESISYETLAHCLLEGLEMNAEEDARCWSELQDILDGCARGKESWTSAKLAGSTSDMSELFVEPSSASSDAKRANARLHFVAALAEWVNMHDLHRPYAMGGGAWQRAVLCTRG